MRPERKNMSKKYRVETQDGITFVRFGSTPKVADIISAIDEIAGDETMTLRLWNMNCGLGEFSTAELKDLAAYGKDRLVVPAKVAIVGEKDLDFGLLRMYEVFREDQYSTHMIFRTEEEGLAWLRGGSGL